MAIDAQQLRTMMKVMKQSYVMKVKQCCSIKGQKQVIDARFHVLVQPTMFNSKASDEG